MDPFESVHLPPDKKSPPPPRKKNKFELTPPPSYAFSDRASLSPYCGGLQCMILLDLRRLRLSSIRYCPRRWLSGRSPRIQSREISAGTMQGHSVCSERSFVHGRQPASDTRACRLQSFGRRTPMTLCLPRSRNGDLLQRAVPFQRRKSFYGQEWTKFVCVWAGAPPH